MALEGKEFLWSTFRADTPLQSECPEYFKEAFVEVILEFIVGDDQVCAYFLISIKINIGLGYQCY